MAATLTLPQPERFCSMIDSMRTLITEANIKFHDDCVIIIGIDNYETVIVDVIITKKMLEENGCKYECSEPGVRGIEIKTFSDILKNVKASNPLKIRIGDDIPNQMEITIDKKSFSSKTLMITPIPRKEPCFSSLENYNYTISVTMGAAEFHDIIKELSSARGNDVVISYENDQIIMTIAGVICSTTLTVNNDAKNYNYCRDIRIPPTKFQFAYIHAIAKAKNISKLINIHLKEKFPIALSYVCPIGEIIFLISPKKNVDDQPNKKRKLKEKK